MYLDNAATTPLCTAAAREMEPYMSKMFFNPSARYTDSLKIKNKLEECRERLAALIGAATNEIYFTSGGTESDNWAIEIGAHNGKRIISQKTEHKAVLNKLKECVKKGIQVSYLPVDSKGMVDASRIRGMIGRDTGFISIMLGNNEIGAIEPVREIGMIAAENGVLLHTDAVQAFAHIPVDVNELQVDMLSGSSHKFGGPKGVGFLYIKSGVEITPLIVGGGQEGGMRSGTQNVPGIVGMVAAAEYHCNNLDRNMNYCRELSKYIHYRIMGEIPDVIFNGPLIGDGRLPGNLNFCFAGIDAAEMLVLLDVRGICASAGSACNANSGSYVLESIGVDKRFINGCLRLGVSETLTKPAADYVVESLKQIISELRSKK